MAAQMSLVREGSLMIFFTVINTPHHTRQHITSVYPVILLVVHCLLPPLPDLDPWADSQSGPAPQFAGSNTNKNMGSCAKAREQFVFLFFYGLSLFPSVTVFLLAI